MLDVDVCTAMPMLHQGECMPAGAVALQLAINHLVPDLQHSNVSPEIAEWSHLVGRQCMTPWITLVRQTMQGHLCQSCCRW